MYSVSGVFEETNRKRRIRVPAKTEDEAVRYAQKEGLIEPFEVNKVNHDKPTERQIEYATALGISIPIDASSQDVSALISKIVDNDSTPNPGLYDFANKRFHFSKYIGKKSLYDLIFAQLDTKEQIAFFVFSIYRYLSDDRHANLDTSPHREVIYTFAESKLNNESFIKSLKKYRGKDLRFFGKMIINGQEINGASVNTIAYQETSNFLNEKFGLSKTKTKKIIPKDKQTKSQTVKQQVAAAAATDKQGCAPIVLFGLAIPLFLKLFL